MRRTCDADVPISLSSDGRFIANETKKRNAAYGVSLFRFVTMPHKLARSILSATYRVGKRIEVMR
ncbi:hypothetical protein [Prevotella intermedia]|uniref:hypothetical protein n=1 Tax=Prevotella intermedia TaxID=28131 RepID=UPI000BE735DE|nr:hypothetical protein [Prevotella intermedia]PDP81170.1 hypothetical protein CLI69_09675 [Prevotella intermedia]